MPFDYTGQVALVTGGATGIGAATAHKLAGLGALVVVADVAETAATETVAAIAAAGGRARFMRVDVADEAQVEALIASIMATEGRLDHAFNNAGVEGSAKKLHETALEDFERTMAINVRGVFLCMKHEIPIMLAQGAGSIVNTASVAGLRGTGKISPYVASKHAVVGLTKAAAVEYSRHGIRVNAVCPAVIRTPMVERSLEAIPKLAINMERMHPIGRLGEAHEVADLVAYLGSDQATFLTGGIYPIDGGYMAT